MLKKYDKENYHRPVLPAPDAVVTDGQCQFGTYNRAIKTINLLAAYKPLGFPASSLINNFRLKEWEAIQLLCHDWFFCIAVYNTKSLGTAIIMAFNRTTQAMHVYQHKVPFWQLKTPQGLGNSHCYYHSKQLTIDIHNVLDDNRVDITFSAKGFSGNPDIHGAFTGSHTTTPIVTVQPFGKNRPLYSHKALMSSEGCLCVGSIKKHYASNASCMIIDDHKGFYPYSMHYDWVTALGYNTEGQLQGFNLTDNQIQDKITYNENALWLNGAMHPLPPVSVKRPNGVFEQWHINDQYGQVDLTFTPLADVPNHLNLGIAKTRYHGSTGVFHGTLSAPDLPPVSFDGFMGMGEQKYIRL